MNHNKLLEIASFSPRSLQFPNAWVGHLPFAAWIIKEVSPKIFVELGAHSGNSYFAFCQSVAEDGLLTKCYAVDTWQGDMHADYYGNEIFTGVNAYNQEHYAEFSRLLRMTFDDAVTHFANESIQLLHIDGLHTYDAVRHDFETWLPKLAPGAVVIFHDTNVRERGFGVWKLWEELQKRYPNNLEFIHSHGLGVLQLNNAPADKKVEWLQPDTHIRQQLKNYFAALGSRQVERYELSWSYKPQIANLNQAVTERDGQIASINQTVAERDGQIASLDQAVAERDRQIASLDQAVAERDGQIASLDQAVAERDRQIANLNQTVNDIFNSKSWRWMRPARYIDSQLKRLLHVIKPFFSAVRCGGGIKNIFRIALELYKNEGLHGIKRGFRFVFNRNDYAEWVRRYDTLTDESRAAMRALISTFAQEPIISVVMPTFNPKVEWLIEAIESVRGQIYTNWELCIAEDCSTNRAIRPLLERYAKEDSRIKVVFREKNGHISEATNSALELSTGEWVALLDHDDVLSEHALFWVANAINNKPDTQLIYSDEDKIDERGQRFDPYFKCDWNKLLFLQQNYVAHLSVLKAGILKSINGFRVGFEGSQDYDLILRYIEKIEEKTITHIPRVLYHWRKSESISSFSTDFQNKADESALIALTQYKERNTLNFGIRVQSNCVGMWNVTYLLSSSPLVSIIIPTKDKVHFLKKCLDGICNRTSYKNIEVIVVDNNSIEKDTFDYYDSLKGLGNIRVVFDKQHFNYSRLNNFGVSQSKGDALLLLNNDVDVINEDWLKILIGTLMQHSVGIVGAKLSYDNNTIQHAGVVLGIYGVAAHPFRHFQNTSGDHFNYVNLTREVSAVTGACLAIRKSIFEQVGGLDEKLEVSYNDVDLCLRVRKLGYKVVYEANAHLYHYESISRGPDDTYAKINKNRYEAKFMVERYGLQLKNDPFYNSNLSILSEGCDYAYPPRLFNPALPWIEFLCPFHRGDVLLALQVCNNLQKNNINVRLHVAKPLFAWCESFGVGIKINSLDIGVPHANKIAASIHQGVKLIEELPDFSGRLVISHTDFDFKRAGLSIVEYFLNEFGLPITQTMESILPAPQEIYTEFFLSSCILIHPNAGWDLKSLPENLLEFIKQIAINHGLKLIQIGGPNDVLSEHVDGSILKNLSVGQWRYLFESALGVVCCDSWMSHFANLADVNRAIIYGSTDKRFVSSVKHFPSTRICYEIGSYVECSPCDSFECIKKSSECLGFNMANTELKSEIASFFQAINQQRVK